MTYRRDSDIVHRYPYGALVATKALRKSYGKTRPTANAIRRRWAKKKKLVAWITSTCPTSVRRENYVRELAKHIQVDIYGACGHKYCGSHDQVRIRDFPFLLEQCSLEISSTLSSLAKKIDYLALLRSRPF